MIKEIGAQYTDSDPTQPPGLAVDPPNVVAVFNGDVYIFNGPNPTDWMLVTGRGAILVWGDNDIGASADTRFLHPSYNSLSIASTDVGGDLAVDWPAPRDGLLRNMFVRHNRPSGDGVSVDYTVTKNGVAQTLTVTLATGAIDQASDLVHSVVVAQGDLIRVRAVKSTNIADGTIEVIVTLEFV